MPGVKMGEPLRCVAFCPVKQNWLAVGLFGGTVVIQDVHQSKTVLKIKPCNQRITCFQWHPFSADMIAFSSFDGKVRVYNFSDRSTF